MPRIKVVLEFISVEEKLPEYQVRILLLVKSGAWIYGYRAQAGGWRDDLYGAVQCQEAVTHWAEIPKIEWPVEENKP